MNAPGEAQDGEMSPVRAENPILRPSMGRLSRLLGNTTAATLDADVAESLRQVGQDTRADGAFAILVDRDGSVTDDWRWVTDGRTNQPFPIGAPLQDGFGSGTEFLRLGHTITLDDVSTIDLSETEQVLAEGNEISAIVIAPVRIGTTLLGVTGVQVCDCPRAWSPTDVAQVEIVADVLVQAVQRTRQISSLAAAEARARRIAEHIPDGLVLLQLDRRVSWVSPSFERSSGRKADEMIGEDANLLVHPDDRHLLKERLATGIESGEGLPIRSLAGDGWRWAEVSWQLMHDDDPMVPDEVLVTVRDVHDKHLRSEALAKQSREDTLTGTLNRIGLEEALTQMAEAGKDVVVGFVDVDRFKAVNDSSGHSAGDAVLRSVAHALRGGVRATDHVARLGGDEFCIVAATDPDNAAELSGIADRLLDSVRTALGSIATISMGLAGPGPAAAADSLMAAADAAMYRAKRAGGDRCEIDRG